MGSPASPAWRKQQRLPAMTMGMIPGGQAEKLPPQQTGTLAAGEPYTPPPAPPRTGAVRAGRGVWGCDLRQPRDRIILWAVQVSSPHSELCLSTITRETKS